MLRSRFLKRAALALFLCFGFGITAAMAVVSYATPTRRESIQTPIFTVGDQNYATAIDGGKNIVKFGPLPFGIYAGGVAFSNYEDAAAHLSKLGKQNDGWGVYRLSGDFQRDTYETAGQSYIDKSLLVISRSAKIDTSAR